MDINNLDKKGELFDSSIVGGETNNNIIHLRIQQRNPRKYITDMGGG
jgi:hypothetical protein